MHEQVLEGVEAMVSGPIRDRQGLLIQDGDEAGGSPLGEMSIRPSAPREATSTKGQAAMNRRQMLIDVIDDLPLARALGCLLSSRSRDCVG